MIYQSIRCSCITQSRGTSRNIPQCLSLLYLCFCHPRILQRSSMATASDTPTPADEKRLANWRTDIPADLVLDQEKLAKALKKEDERMREEKDESKGKYNVRWNDEVSPEEMEAYRMKKIHHDDPMKDFLH